MLSDDVRGGKQRTRLLRRSSIWKLHPLDQVKFRYVSSRHELGLYILDGGSTFLDVARKMHDLGL